MDQLEEMFQDANKYGYVATQMTHFPQLPSYNPGNIMSYVPLYDGQTSTKDLITDCHVFENFFSEVHKPKFSDRLNSVQLVQRDCLNDPSIYIINRKSLLANKSQVFHNDDASSLLCLPLMTNSLKWSESFLGDTMLIDASCKYEEPIHRCTMDFDWPKISLFKIGQNDYLFSPPQYGHGFD